MSYFNPHKEKSALNTELMALGCWCGRPRALKKVMMQALLTGRTRLV